MTTEYLIWNPVIQSTNLPTRIPVRSPAITSDDEAIARRLLESALQATGSTYSQGAPNSRRVGRARRRQMKEQMYAAGLLSSLPGRVSLTQADDQADGDETVLWTDLAAIGKTTAELIREDRGEI